MYGPTIPGTLSAADLYGNRGAQQKTTDKTQPTTDQSQKAASQNHATGKPGMGMIALLAGVGILIGFKFIGEKGFAKGE